MNCDGCDQPILLGQNYTETAINTVVDGRTLQQGMILCETCVRICADLAIKALTPEQGRRVLAQFEQTTAAEREAFALPPEIGTRQFLAAAM